MVKPTGLSLRYERPRSRVVRDLIAQVKSEKEADLDIDTLDTPNSNVIVARLDGEPVGCIAFRDRVRFGEVYKLCVTEAARGRGVAGSLVLAFEDAARHVGLRRVVLSPAAAVGASVPRLADLGFLQNANGGGDWFEKTL